MKAWSYWLACFLFWSFGTVVAVDTSHIDKGQGARERADEKDPNKLRKYGEGGNKSFEIRVTLKEKGHFGNCQGTLIKGCRILIAAHCAEEFENGETTEVETADFGKVSAKVIPHPEYEKATKANKGKETVTKDKDGGIIIHKPYAPNDIGLLQLDQNVCQKNTKVEVQPVCEATPKGGETIYGASAHKGKLLVGTVRGDIGSPNRDWIQVMLDSEGIKQGDSGGGIFVKRKNAETKKDELCVAGALSTGGTEKDSKGFMKDASYASDKSLDWVREQIRSI